MYTKVFITYGLVQAGTTFCSMASLQYHPTPLLPTVGQKNTKLSTDAGWAPDRRLYIY